jgi:dihydroneopterin aldolase
MAKPAKSDNLKDAVDYQKIYRLIKKEMGMKSHLLENIAQRIIDAITEYTKKISKIKVKVSKMNPPMGGKINCVSVTMEKDID